MTRIVQLFEASAAYQVLVLAAAIDAGAFPPADERVLLVSANSPVPEVARRLDDDPLLAPLLPRFDRVVSFNDLIAPLHPKAFRPRAEEVPLFERAFRRELGIPQDARVELALESVHVPPARTILNVFADAPVTVYAEGLMSYGPTRDPLNPRMWARIERVLHLDLVEGLAPILLSEHDVPAELVPGDAFRAVVAGLAGPAKADVEPYALLLGQYLAELGLTTTEREAELYGRCIDAAAAQGLRRVVYKPHPSAPPLYAAALARRAEQRGVAFAVSEETGPAEVLYERERPQLVLGCFSTGLVTASRFWRIPVAAIGTREVLASLPRIEDSNRVPLALVDLVVPGIGTGDAPALLPPREPDVATVQRIVRAVAYCMQWRARGRDRDEVAADLFELGDAVEAYVPRARLRRLLLPGGGLGSVSAATFQRLTGVLAGLRERQQALLTSLRRRGAPLRG
ncbi:polysialyltransferase family glycosyltransferase [Amnibacterium sp. CER49]|uniref:polysialyltransferase family glycosyltransferase n=1 Tax=Amnibacterium sp. CER49 TaxID=3039161 RepID=UPI00244A7C20|nr:polysialyltransferase family glycosyltransferase [Amnibacterium sp. CER49]MDH2445228.1 polysialyltransferase family glycosyltransferase [Amnibacterium sp. CER49]